MKTLLLLLLSLTSYSAMAGNYPSSYGELDHLYDGGEMPSLNDFVLDTMTYTQGYMHYARTRNEPTNFLTIELADGNSNKSMYMRMFSLNANLSRAKEVLAREAQRGEADRLRSNPQAKAITMRFNNEGCYSNFSFRKVKLPSAASIVIARNIVSGPCETSSAGPIYFGFYLPLHIDEQVVALETSDLFVGEKIVGQITAGSTYIVSKVNGRWIMLKDAAGKDLAGWVDVLKLRQL